MMGCKSGGGGGGGGSRVQFENILKFSLKGLFYIKNILNKMSIFLTKCPVRN